MKTLDNARSRQAVEFVSQHSLNPFNKPCDGISEEQCIVIFILSLLLVLFFEITGMENYVLPTLVIGLGASIMLIIVSEIRLDMVAKWYTRQFKMYLKSASVREWQQFCYLATQNWAEAKLSMPASFKSEIEYSVWKTGFEKTVETVLDEVESGILLNLIRDAALVRMSQLASERQQELREQRRYLRDFESTLTVWRADPVLR